jgi:transposase-like protein
MQNSINSLSNNDIIKLMEQMRWGKKTQCPHCNCDKIVDYIKENKFQCENCFRSFSVVSKTEFENTKLPLNTWILAYYLINENKDIQAESLNKWLNVTQKTSIVIHEKIVKMISEKNWFNKIIDLPFYKNQLVNY